MPIGSFANPITGVDNALVVNQIESQGFVPGINGWIIRKDGTAEFADITVRGKIIVENSDDGVFVYAYIPG